MRRARMDAPPRTALQAMEYRAGPRATKALGGGAMTIDQESAQLGYGPAKHDPQGLLMSQLARDTLALVLAGGRGSRLGPLTDWRAKPAVPFGRQVRSIHFLISHCGN